MRLSPRNRAWPRCGYLLGIAASLCAYLLTAFGFPVVVPRAARSENAPAVAVKPCGCAVAETEQKGCCCCSGQGGGSCCGGERKEEPAPAPSEPAVGWVLGESVLRCQGVATSWVAAGAVLPPPCPLTWRPFEVCGELCSPCDPVLVAIPHVPPAPPPRSVSV
jgi:hypothetical protein